ncbi:MAG: ABC transporter permease [Desulfovibrionaceae bacterium]
MRWLPYLLTVACLGGAWKVLSLLLGSSMLPAPEAAGGAFFLALGTKAFWGHFGASAWRAGAAMAAAWLVAFPLGVAMGGSKRLDAALGPLVFLTYPIPKIVLLPLAFLLFGLGDASKIVMIALILGYQVLVTTRDGVLAVHPKHLDAIRSLGASRLQVATEVLIPAALPHGFTALRLNAGVSVAVLFFVESFATQTGLGYLIMDAWGRLDYVSMFIGIFGMSLLGVVLYETANLLERHACAWKGAGARR